MAKGIHPCIDLAITASSFWKSLNIRQLESAFAVYRLGVFKWYTCLLSYRESSCNTFQASVIPLIPFSFNINLIALFWANYNVCMSLVRYGSQTSTAYSSIGLQSEEYATYFTLCAALNRVCYYTQNHRGLANKGVDMCFPI